jgi:hypothetical protein
VYENRAALTRRFVISHLLQDIREIVALGPCSLWIDTEVTNLLVGWRVTTVGFDGLNNGVEIVECDISTLSTTQLHPLVCRIGVIHLSRLLEGS